MQRARRLDPAALFRCKSLMQKRSAAEAAVLARDNPVYRPLCVSARKVMPENP
jgi:hypothetical protein